MGKYKTSEAQRRAVKRYKKRNPERTKITRYRTNARTFARHYATKEDMENLMEVFKKENKNYKRENKMTKQYENLMAVHYDKANNTYTLEFQDEDETEFIEVDAKEHEQAKEDEFYFDNNELVEQIIDENFEKVND